MNLYSYVITHDYGFAPNPFQGVLTLATCKPQIRKRASVGDLIMGSGSASGIGNGKIIFVGEVSRTPTTEEYANNALYTSKIPDESIIDGKKGDNIYYKKAGEWYQRENPYHNYSNKENDLSCERVLVCAKFWYFGKNAPQIPEKFNSFIKKGPAHKIISDKNALDDFLAWINTFQTGINGRPSSLLQIKP